jgi:hypothetical protein
MTTNKQPTHTAHSLFLQAVDIVGKEEFARRMGREVSTVSRYISGDGTGKISANASSVTLSILAQTLMK